MSSAHSDFILPLCCLGLIGFLGFAGCESKDVTSTTDGDSLEATASPDVSDDGRATADGVVDALAELPALTRLQAKGMTARNMDGFFALVEARAAEGWVNLDDWALEQLAAAGGKKSLTVGP